MAITRKSYPRFVVNGKDYGSILTQRQAEELPFAHSMFMKAAKNATDTPVIQLYLSRKMSIQDVMTLGDVKHSYDFALPQGWIDRNMEEHQRTPHVWLYDTLLGHAFAPFDHVYPRIVDMIYEQWLEHVEKLMEDD